MLDELPDGGAPLDLIRAAGVRLLVALRFGNVGPALEATTVLMPVLSDVRILLARTSFLFTRAAGLIAHGDYRDAHKLLGILEKESLTYRIDLAQFP